MQFKLDLTYRELSSSLNRGKVVSSHRSVSSLRTGAFIVAVTLFISGFATPANAADPLPTRKVVEQKLAELGLPVGKVDGSWNANSRRAFCVWRELTGRKISTKNLTNQERRDVINAPVNSWIIPTNMVIGLNINQVCQSATWVQPNEGTEAAPALATSHVTAVFPVSSGMRSFPTTRGIHTVYRTIDAWHESTKYKGAMMYRPIYFHGGEAIHGSATDRLVKTYPASHGCVRMLHADIDRLWAAGFGKGSQINVYGKWRG